MISNDLKKQIGEFNSPQSRVLVSALFVAIIVVWSLFLKDKGNERSKSDIREKECNEDNKRLHHVIDSMNIDKYKTIADINIDRQSERKRISDQQDSTIKIMQKIINNIK